MMIPDYENSRIKRGRATPFAELLTLPPIAGEVGSFTMIAGDSGDWAGYSNGDLVPPPFNPPVGSISDQPLAFCTLQALFQDTATQSIVAVFGGAAIEAFAGMTLRIGGETLASAGTTVAWGSVFVPFPNPITQIVAGQSYNCKMTVA